MVAAIVDKEVYQLRVISGETDVAYVQTSFEDFSLYKENEARGDYRVIPVPGIYGSEVMFGLNQNDPDPAMRALFQDLRFRRALSLAINRAEINDIVYYGLLVPRQAPSCRGQLLRGGMGRPTPSMIPARPTGCWTRWA